MAAASPLEYAIQMEIDGQRYYAEAAGRTTNPLGRKMFESLAVDERRHEAVVRQIADEMDVTMEGELPKRRLVTLFSTLGEELKRDLSAEAADLAVIDKAIEMEKASVAHYQKQQAAASSEAHRTIYERLAHEEGEHMEILASTRTYLESSSQWFLWDEQSLLDGG